MKVEHALQHRIISNNHLAVIPNYFLGSFECDLFVMNKNLYTTEYEVKHSKRDFDNDFKKSRQYFDWKEQSTSEKNKHAQISGGLRTNRFYFVIEASVSSVAIPKYAGLITFHKSEHGRTTFDYKKRAPLIHKNKANDKQVKKCLERLNWRYYIKVWESK